MTIGYGLNVYVFEEYTLEKNLDLVCVRLISRFPLFKDDNVIDPRHLGKQRRGHGAHRNGEAGIGNLVVEPLEQA